MKNLSIQFSVLVGVLIFLISACSDLVNLDREPLSNVTPNQYLKREADLAAYTIARYNFPTHGGWNVGTFGIDNHTDNQAATGYSNRWAPGQWRVPQSGGSWSFGRIYDINYFLETAVPRWENGNISGNQNNVDHYIGEGYFLRAYEYFQKVKALGDFPIVRKTLKDDMETLVEASQRRPRNEVARFIISDLDSAITLLQDNPPGGKNRISRNAALLFKSRVALHEATWLKYHKGTAHVPGGPGWPGEGKVKNFNINIDQEIDYFLTQAMEASEEVADKISLTPNTQAQEAYYNNPPQNPYSSADNPYFKMFADQNLDQYEEVLLWRDYDPTKGILHNVNHYINQNGGNTGYTRSFVDNFLMDNGLPIYAQGSGYAGDDSIRTVKLERDNRLQLFMKAPGELRFTDATNSDGTPILESIPDIITLPETRYVTGYAVKKGLSYESAQVEGNAGSIGSIVFRGVEAYLNYIEASYLKEGAINGKADQYWRAIRNRAGVNPDYMVTVNATDMQEEAKNDFAAYSAGQLLNDRILYNIRRERRSELMAEGLRYFDLKRWRALDQLKNNPHIIEGFKLWGPMQNWYDPGELVEPGEGGTPNVSSSSESKYLRPYRINLSSSNFVKDGYSWAYAHYLNPIAIEHFSITTTGESSDLESSVMYQNPGWPLQANAGAEQ